MRGSWSNVENAARAFWRRLREWCGDAAYDRYQSAVARKKTGCALTREQFYVEQLNRKYSKPSRCC